MVRPRPPLRGLAAPVLGLAVLALLIAGTRPAYTDDIDLLRTTTAKPYVFFILDNSASMSLSPSGKWVHANGDDPRSKIYQAKKVIYEVFKGIDDVQFGFASFNQDYPRVTAKHWLYYWNDVDVPGNKLPNDWPLSYPVADVDGPISTAVNGVVSDDIDGDLWTFGTHLDATGILGTCNAPKIFGAVGADDRETINRYAKLGAAGNGPTYIWLKGGAGNKTYRLTVEHPAKKSDNTTDNPVLGRNDMNVKLTMEQVQACITDQTFDVQKTWTATLELTLWTEFLMYDENNGRSAPNGDKAGGVDYAAGFWDAKDIQDVATCGSGHPFSGKGWEGNYDTTPVAAGSPIDPYCRVAGDNATCYNLKRATVTDPDYGRALDKGDMLAFDWRTEQKAEFLQRVVPNYGSASPDFRIASYFKDTPDASTGHLKLEDSDQIPLFATGPSPLGKAVIDFRCWFLGEGNKCNESAYNPGWQTIAAGQDREWACRRPYLIVLSDGGDSCAGENPCADTANLNSSGGVKTWVIAYGANCSATGNPLKCMAQNGKGELICPQDPSELKTELLRILGQILSEARSFASAAVPSVQAIVEDKIFLTNFTPLQGVPVWDGHVHSFLKPLPLNDLDKKPDLTHPNHLWDAGEVMAASQLGGIGTDEDERRVYYPMASLTDTVPATSRYFQGTTTSDPSAIRYDFWRGLGYVFTEGDTSSEASTESAANAVVAKTYALKHASYDVTDPITKTTKTINLDYVLGDVFHSNPLVVGSPPNTQYYTLNLNNYQDFATKHRLRRKLLIVGANDGMLHAFDAGKWDSVLAKEAEDRGESGIVFDNGTGKEIFAFMPRGVMNTVRLIADPATTLHKWGVDGTVTVADVYIDPDHNGTPTPSEREWRTVVLGGLRQGGSSYYAVDITQPDKLKEKDGEFQPEPFNAYVPSCLEGASFSPSDKTICGPTPFPSVLWEFDDTVVTASGERSQLDEDNGTGNGIADLTTTWSVPNVGRIRIAQSTGSETNRDVYVAIFGGGLDTLSQTNSVKGNWVYIQDIETGKIIYKRQLEGSVPGEAAAVDTNQDGYLDRIYVGTTQGFLYRIDLTTDVKSGSKDVYPALTAQMVHASDGNLYAVQRIPTTSWVPRKLFDANWDAATGTQVAVARPIFFRPSVLYDAKLGAYLLAFGVGDRADLWTKTTQSGRFYLFADDTDNLSAVMDERNFKRVNVTDPALGGSLETEAAGRRGWYMVLSADERVVNDTFALSGVTFFSTYIPEVTNTTTGGGNNSETICKKGGSSRVFIVSTLNADPFVAPPAGVTAPPTRMFQVKFNLVTNPFAEQGQTKNESTGVAELCDDPTKLAIMESLKSLFPPTCKFSNYRVDIKTISQDTSLVCIAPVPVCLIEKNWKEY